MAEKRKRKRVQAGDQNQSDTYYEIPNTSIARGDYAEAIRLLKKSIQIEPTSMEAHFKIRLAYSKVGQYEQAIKHLNRIINLSPENAGAPYSSLASLYNLTKRPAHMNKILNKLIALSHQDKHYLSSLALAYMNIGNYDQAIDTFNKALEQDPQNANIHFCSGVTYRNNEKYAEAIEAPTKAIALQPVSPEAYNALGACYFGVGRFKEAIER